jgi:hypothetical protein
MREYSIVCHLLRAYKKIEVLSSHMVVTIENDRRPGDHNGYSKFYDLKRHSNQSQRETVMR